VRTHVERSDLRALAEHEARLQAAGGRELRDLGDAILLIDPRDPEPYWNRLVAPDWPAGSSEFGRRLDAVITIFAALGRVPHIWPFPSRNHPANLVDRLVAAGFEVMGSDRLMVHVDPEPAMARASQPLSQDVTLVRLRGLSPASLRWTPGVAAVLADAFGVDEERRAAFELETLASLEGPALNVVLALADGQPAAVAKRSTFGGLSYLSSIGTRRTLRHRGLGGLVTAIAVVDALAAGSRRIYLKVDVENHEAQRLYEGYGFTAVPGQIDDLLLR
jgi:ribosomal protein S18 acetylase RimI-like enzyme